MSIIDNFGQITDLGEAVNLLSVGIQDTPTLNLTVADFHPDLQELLKMIGLQDDTVVLQSRETPDGKIYVNTMQFGRFALKTAPDDELIVIQTPGFFGNWGKIIDSFDSMDKSWDLHTLTISIKNGAVLTIPVPSEIKYQEKKGTPIRALLSTEKSKIKNVYHTFVAEKPKNGLETTEPDVFALMDDERGLGFVKVGTPFTLLKDIPDGSYDVISVWQENAVRNGDNHAFISYKMQLIDKDDKLITVNAPRPICNLVTPAKPKVTASDESYFYRITTKSGGIVKTKRDQAEIIKAIR